MDILSHMVSGSLQAERSGGEGGEHPVAGATHERQCPVSRGRDSDVCCRWRLPLEMERELSICIVHSFLHNFVLSPAYAELPKQDSCWTPRDMLLH